MGNKRTVVVIFGGKSAEHEVSIESAKTVCESLRGAGFPVFPLYIPREGAWLKSAPWERPSARRKIRVTPRPDIGAFCLESGARIRPYAVFPIIHGTTGEDGKLQGLLEIMNLPYVGCGVLASAAGMDKALSKKLAESAGVPVLKHVLVRASDSAAELRSAFAQACLLGFPLFVKPLALGSSVGVSKVRRKSELAKAVKSALSYDSAAMIEKGVDMAREIVCGVLGDSVSAKASICGEVRPKGKHEFFDYEAKYTDDDGMDFLLPAPISRGVSEKMRVFSVKVFSAMGCSGLARIDFFIDPKNENKIRFCEINTAPGFTSHSLYPRLWERSGIKKEPLVKRLVDIAVKEWKARQSHRTVLGG